MEATAAFAPTQPFSASEMVYLFGTQFAGKSNAPVLTPHLPDNKETRLEDLVQHLLAAAFLANERDGALRLDVRAKKVLFGLRTTQAVYATATATPPSAPEGSWEQRIQQRLLKAKGQTEEVEQVVFALLPMSQAPFGEVIGQLLAALNKRGMLNVVDTKVLKVFHSKRYSLKSGAADAAAAQSLDAVKQLLESDKATRPELHALLLRAVRRGVERNQESDDGPDVSTD